MDLNAGLTQVLQDGTNTYLYGVNRIAQVAETQTGYFLPDALGSVRNITDENGEITLTQSYTPCGEVMASEGTTQTTYAFTGEMYDPQTGLVYLRARYLGVSDGRFLSRDAWQGDYNTPMSYNAWLYASANPVVYTDPSGQFSCFMDSDSPRCMVAAAVTQLKAGQLKSDVEKGDKPPVKAFSTLVNYAYNAFDHDVAGMMWGVTNVILGYDPNDVILDVLGPALLGGDRPEWNYLFGKNHGNRYYAGQNWLPFNRKGDGAKDSTYLNGSPKVFSERGDWNPAYFDGSADQALHFWQYAATTYYDSITIALLANAYHDPFFLESMCGEDLSDLRTNYWRLNQVLEGWRKNTPGTSVEDFKLSLVGMAYGGFAKAMVMGPNLPYQPGGLLYDLLRDPAFGR